MDKRHTCCILGHRTIIESEELTTMLYGVIERMILDEKVDTFLFGSKSRFNDLCFDLVTKIKEKHPHIRRIYVRAEYPYISKHYKDYLLKSYEDTFYPEKILGSGKSVYIKRNREMIDNSRFCIVYYDEKIAPANRKSGTKLALDYARKKGKYIVKLPI
ncbi:MAG: hypothetical protein IKM53_04430 [Clostridia bacterium]|nr:hypothetical protein [Clostridia bacterium]